MCPEYYYAQGPKRSGPPMALCRATDPPKSLTEDQVNQMCRNNCTSCVMYRSRHTSTRPPVSQGQNKSGSSSSGMGTIIVIAAAAALVTKFLGIW